MSRLLSDRFLWKIAMLALLASVQPIAGSARAVSPPPTANPSTVTTIEERRDFLFYYNRALGSIEESHWTEAIEDLSKSIELNPDFVPALVNRGNVYLETGDFPRARVDYESALKRQPNDPFARNNLGLVYLNSEQPDEAIREFSRALSLDEEYAEAYFNRGLALLNLGKNHEAIADLDRAITLFERQGDGEAVAKTREIRDRIGSSGRSGGTALKFSLKPQNQRS